MGNGAATGSGNGVRLRLRRIAKNSLRSRSVPGDGTERRPELQHPTERGVACFFGATCVGVLLERMRLHLATQRFLAERRGDRIWEASFAIMRRCRWNELGRGCGRGCSSSRYFRRRSRVAAGRATMREKSLGSPGEMLPGRPEPRFLGSGGPHRGPETGLQRLRRVGADETGNGVRHLPRGV